MGLQILIEYKEQPLIFDVTTQETDIYRLCRTQADEHLNGEYIPEKIIIRRKGKIWVSDIETSPELIQALTREVIKISPEIY